MINFACFLTLSRIALTPIIVLCMLQAAWSAALSLFALACLTDVLDGFVARTFHQHSKLGQILDPLADKILLSSVMLALVFIVTPELSVVRYAFYFLLAKELIILSGGAWLWFGHGIFIKPSVLSRVVSLSEVVLVALMFAQALGVGVMTSMITLVIGVNVLLSAALLIRYLMIVTQR
jgi:cardiolipin synthase